MFRSAISGNTLLNLFPFCSHIHLCSSLVGKLGIYDADGDGDFDVDDAKVLLGKYTFYFLLVVGKCWRQEYFCFNNMPIDLD